jgi:phospholipid transport system substrate-binding protein
MKVLLSTVFALLMSFALLSNSYANEEKNIRDFLQNVTDSSLEIIASNTIDESTKEEGLTELFLGSVDTRYVGRYVLGKYWKRLDEDKQKYYLDLYTKFVISSYVPKFREYSGQKVEIDSVTKDGKGYLVKSRVIREPEENISVGYKVHKNNGKYQIYDIIAEGVSLSITQRSDFSSMISRKSLDYFLERLENKVNSIK